MEKKKPDLDIIIRYLNFWDPTGEYEDIIAGGGIPDPYDSYALRIHKELESGCTTNQLLKVLEKIQTEEMGRNFDREKATTIAEGLVICFREETERFY